MTIKMNEAKLLQAIKVYGIQTQIIVLLEEMAELQKELCKLQRNRGSVEHITEELADVLIMLHQLQMVLNLKDERIREIVDFKIDRLSDRMRKEGKNDF